MSWLPKSPKARRRLWVVAAVAPILALAVGLSLWAMQDSVTFFYSPSEATADKAPEGRNIRLGGLVEAGSVQKSGDGIVACSAKGRGSWRKGPSAPTAPSTPARSWPSTTRTICRARSPTG